MGQWRNVLSVLPNGSRDGLLITLLRKLKGWNRLVLLCGGSDGGGGRDCARF